MSGMWLRVAEPEDLDGIAALHDLTFGGPGEGELVRRIGRDGDSLLSLIAHDEQRFIGHIQMFKIAIDGTDIAAGLGPMGVHPDRQRSGIGGQMIRFALAAMEGAGRVPVFVLGHREYYPKFGFSADAAKPFTAPWDGPSFMAALAPGSTAKSGELRYPAAFSAST